MKLKQNLEGEKEKEKELFEMNAALFISLKISYDR